MPGGKETVICKQCLFKFNLVSGEVKYHDHEITQVGKPGSASNQTIELRRYHLRLLCPGQTNQELFEFDRPPTVPTFKFVEGDQVLLIFCGQGKQLLRVHNQSTTQKLTVKAPQSEALFSAQVLAISLGLICTGYLWINKITNLTTALIGSSVLSMGFGYGVYRKLQPQEKDLDTLQRLGAVQDFLKVQHRVEHGLEATRNIQTQDQTLKDQLLALKDCMALEPDLYGERVHACNLSISLMGEKSALLEKQASGYMRILNMLKVDALTSQIADQLPDAIDADLVNQMAQLELITEQVERLAQQIHSAESLRLESIR